MYSTRVRLVQCLNKLRQVLPSMAQPGAASPPSTRARLSFRSLFPGLVWVPRVPMLPITQLSYDHSKGISYD